MNPGKKENNIKRPMCFISLSFTVFIVIFMAFRPPEPYYDGNHEFTETVIEGRVTEKYLKNSSFHLKISDARGVCGRYTDKESHNIIVHLDKDTVCFSQLPRIGSTCRIHGMKSAFSKATNPGQFDMAFYEMIHGYDYQLTGAEITAVDSGYDHFRELMSRVRWKWECTYDLIFNADDAGIAKSMVLGDKNGLGDEIKGLYQRAGIAHALCISGLHISLIGYGIYRMLRKIFPEKRTAAAAGMAVMLLYGSMTGMGLSTVRALIMFTMVLAADLLGRSYDILTALLFAGLVLLAMNPYTIYDSGFMLSFGAVLGIGLIYPELNALISIRSKLLDMLKVSISVNLFTLPVTLYFFYQFPVYSILINLIAVPLMGVLLFMMISAGITGMFILPAGKAAAVPCHFILLLYGKCCRINDSLPGSVLIAGRPELWKIGLYYILLMSVLGVLVYTEKNKKKITAGISAVTISAALLVLIVKVRPPLMITMLDIGQGDCNFIQCRDGTSYMIDCGSTDEKNIAEYRVVPYLKSTGTGHIDYAFITHTDADHISGYEELFSESDAEGIRIDNFIMPETGTEDDEYQKLKRMALKKGIHVYTISAGMTIKNDMLKLTCLHPESGYICEDRNEYSTVLDLNFGAFSALFTGDIQGEGEKKMMARIEHAYTLLKCAHHGSANSTPAEFLAMTRPQLCFISCGKDNNYGHPHPELIERVKKSGSEIYITMKDGAITCTTDGKAVKTAAFIGK